MEMSRKDWVIMAGVILGILIILVVIVKIVFLVWQKKKVRV
jgi:hypothetical protein